MRYYIYIEPTNTIYHKDSFGEVKYYDSRFNDFALSKTDGKSFSEGHFCGAAGFYGFKGCKVIGEAKSRYSFREKGGEVICEYEYEVKRVDKTRDIEDGAAWRYDQEEADWHSFEADSDDEAFGCFEVFCLKNKENREM